jgi:mitochondrial intermembrane space import and assembly protein 40
MLRLPSRATARLAQSSLAPARTIPGRHFLSTTPPHLKRSWKGSAARWSIAIAGIYWYTTSPIFAEEPSNSKHDILRLPIPTNAADFLNPNLDKLEEETGGTSLEALTSRPRRQQSKEASVLASDVASSENASTTTSSDPSPAQSLEDEADQQGAFNPETGEINWDCPCLGGMAHGPCGPQFREAFSCFVYSTEEPKGMDCIEKFQGMQDCFKEHPDVYKGELEDEGDEGEYDEAMAAEKEELVKEIRERREAMGVEADGSQRRLLEEVEAPKSPTAAKSGENRSSKASSEAKASTEGHPQEKEHVNKVQSSQTIRNPTTPPIKDGGPGIGDADDLIPKAAHDARSAQVPRTEN